MTNNFFIIITISTESLGYDILLNYLHAYSGMRKLYIIPNGLLVELSFEDYIDRREWISSIIKLDVDEITFHEILYEEFIPRK